MTALLHLIQPLARLSGRMTHGLTPWRRRHSGLSLPVPHRGATWSERWRATEDWLGAVERRLIDAGGSVRRGGEFDRWELEVGGGLFASARVRMALEEHGAGRQLARYRAWPRIPVHVVLVTIALTVGALAAFADGKVAFAAVAALVTVLLLVRLLREASGAMAALWRALEHGEECERA